MLINLYKLDENHNKNDVIKWFESNSKNKMVHLKSVIERVENSSDQHSEAVILLEVFKIEKVDMGEALPWSFLVNSTNGPAKEGHVDYFYNDDLNDEIMEGIDNQAKENLNYDTEPLLKSGKDPDAISFITIYDKKTKELTRYAISFGYSSQSLVNFIDDEFPFRFAAHFDEIEIKTTYVRFPFSITNKSLSGHTGLNHYHGRPGSYLEQIDFNINNGIPKEHEVLLGENKNHTASNHLSFPIRNPSNNIQSLLNYVWYIHELQAKKAPKLSFDRLSMLRGEKLKKIKQEIFNDISKVEFKAASTGLTRIEPNSFKTHIELLDCDLVFESKRVKANLYVSSINDTLPKKIADDNISVLYEIFTTDMELNSLYSGKFIDFINDFKLKDDSGKIIGNIMHFFDFIFSYEDVKYIHSDGKIFIPKNDIDNMIKNAMDEIDGMTEFIEYVNLEELVGEIVINDNSLMNEGDDNCPRLYYGEIMFNYSFVNYINKKFVPNSNEDKYQDSLKKKLNIDKAYLLDRKLTKLNKVEVSDIASLKDGVLTFSHVKFGINNKDLSYNIDQLITSHNLLLNKDEDLQNLLNKNSLENYDVGFFELIILVNEAEYDRFRSNADGKFSWNNLNGRTISKFKLLELAHILSSNNKGLKIKVIKSTTNFKDWKNILDPNKELQWTKGKD